MITLCEKCHNAHHEGTIVLKLMKPSTQNQMTIMNILSHKLSELYEPTFGYLTKMKRLEQDLDKSHVNDAFVIAGGTKDMVRLDCAIVQKQVRRNNRKLFRGSRSELPNQCPKEVFGFRLFDRVIFAGKKYFVWGRRMRGVFLIRDLTGNKLERNYKKLHKIKGQSSFLTEIQCPSGPKTGVPLE